MPALLGAVIKFTRQFLVEKNYELAGSGAVFRSPKTKNVHPGFPRDRFRRALEGCDGVREARPVHMNEKRMLVGKLANSFDLASLVNRAEFSRLRDTQDPQLRRMNIGMPKERCGDVVEVELPIRAGSRNEFGAAGKKFGRAAFVSLAVRAFVANHAMIRAAKMGQRERVSGRAVENQKDFAVPFENLAYSLDDASGPLVVAVGNVGPGIRFRESRPRRRTNRCRVIARKVVTRRRRIHRRFSNRLRAAAQSVLPAA